MISEFESPHNFMLHDIDCPLLIEAIGHSWFARLECIGATKKLSHAEFIEADISVALARQKQHLRVDVIERVDCASRTIDVLGLDRLLHGT